MFGTVLRAGALVLGALSLGLSFAHVLEAPPRLRAWPPELWRDATVFHGQYALFGKVGGPLEVATVLLMAAVAGLAVRRRGPAEPVPVLAALLFAGALGIWLTVVSPANGIMATWRPGPLPADFADVQKTWEGGHAAMAALKLLGFMALAMWVGRAASREKLGCKANS